MMALNSYAFAIWGMYLYAPVEGSLLDPDRDELKNTEWAKNGVMYNFDDLQVHTPIISFIARIHSAT
jgi:hypothetical protein